MKQAFALLAAACLASCGHPGHVEHPDKPWGAPAMPHSEWQRIEARFKKASYPRPALGFLSDFDRATIEGNMRSPFINQSRGFTILSSDIGRHTRMIGMVLDRDVPADVSHLAAILSGEAPDPHRVKILSIEILGVLPEHENRMGNNLSVVFRSD
jgi:hypothetical protein